MKKIFIPVILLMLVTMACSLTGGSKPTPIPPTEVVIQLPTQPPAPTSTTAPTEPPVEPTVEQPTEEPTPEETGGYFVEEFDGDLSAWIPFVIAGNAEKEFSKVVSGRLKFELPNTETYAYVENTQSLFDDVYVETSVETVKGGENGISLFCRGSDKGFYEFRVHTVGRYAGTIEAYRFDFSLRDRKKVPYVNLLKDRERLSTYDIKAGYNTNILGLMCVGDEIRLFINGVEQLPMPGGEPIRDSTLAEGTVGVGVMSFNQGDVDVEIDSISTSAP